MSLRVEFMKNVCGEEAYSFVYFNSLRRSVTDFVDIGLKKQWDIIAKN